MNGVLDPFLYCRKIKGKYVKDVLGKIKNRKAIGLNSIPIDVWKSIDYIGLIWLVKLFNKTLGFKEFLMHRGKTLSYQST